jgi:toxin ParE1/3/4
VSARYVVRPKADQDLDDQAYYLATQANPEVGHKFLLAAHETFSLLATQPEMGWNCRLKDPGAASFRVFRVAGFERVLVLYRPRPRGVEILRAGGAYVRTVLVRMYAPQIRV